MISLCLIVLPRQGASAYWLTAFWNNSSTVAHSSSGVVVSSDSSAHLYGPAG